MSQSKLSRHHKRELARILFMDTDLSQGEIAEKVGATPKSISAWKKADEWESIRQAHKLTPRNFKKRLYEIVTEVIEGKRKPNPKEADALVKYARAINLLDKQENLANYIQVFQSFEKWLQELDPKFTKKVNEYHDKFIHEKITALNG